MSETIELRQHVLGMEPYILLTLRLGGEGPDDLRIGVEYGGGVDDPRVPLLLALSEMGPLAQEEIDMLTGADEESEDAP